MRIIANILFDGEKVVHSFNFQRHHPIGSLECTLKMFQIWETDEIMILCVNNSNHELALNLLSKIEVNTPITLGGGFSNAQQALSAIAFGIERIAVGSASLEKVQIVYNLVNAIGEEAILPIIDYIEQDGVFFTKFGVPLQDILHAFSGWKSEIMLQSVDLDGLIKFRRVDNILSICQLFPNLRFILSGSSQFFDFKSLDSESNVSAISLDRCLGIREASYLRIRNQHLESIRQ